MSENMITKMNDFLQHATVVDLSHKLTKQTPALFGQHPFEMTLAVSKEKDGTPFVHSNVCLNEHTGTHMDAPSHFYYSESIDEINPSQLMGKAAVIHLPGHLTASKKDIQEWEAEHGTIEKGDYVLFGFDWDQYFYTDKFYAKPWPGLVLDAAQYLADKGVKGIGVDTLTLDVSTDEACSCHFAVLSQNILIIENLNNLGKLPPWCMFVCLPLPFDKGTASPVRPVAIF